MAAGAPSDVDVLDDLLHDVDGVGDGDTFEDAEAFFDADPEHDGEGLGDMTTDNILSQLDAVTDLEDDDALGDNVDEFHDTASTSSPQLSGADERTVAEIVPTIHSEENIAEEDSEPVSQEPTLAEQTSPISGEDVVQAVLDLATDAEDEIGDEEEDQEHLSQNMEENEAVLPTQDQTALPHTTAEEEDDGISGAVAEAEPSTEATIQSNEGEEAALVTETVDAAMLDPTSDASEQVEDAKEDDTNEAVVVTHILDAVVASPSSDETGQNADDGTDATIEAEENIPPALPVREAVSEVGEAYSDPPVVPPPAPTAIPVIVGSMNPVEDENDDSDDSHGEEDDESAPLPPPLQLNDPDEDDEDVLEVDAAVVSTLEIEEKQRMEKRALSVEPTLKAAAAAVEEENTLLKALPSINNDTSAIDLSFGEEVRVARVTTLEPSSPFSDIHKMAGGANAGKLSADATFGISYQSMRKKADEPHATADEAAAASTSPTKHGDIATSADEDEFAFDIKPAAELDALSEDELRAWRESLEAQKRKEEEELLKELKRATDEEKRLIESNKAMEAANADSTTGRSAEAAVEPDALSLTELHSIYKRGLGDQEVLMDENENIDAVKKTEAPEIGRSMSVMGRIFSQTQGATETIAEEADGDDDDDTEDNRGSSDNVNVVDDNAEDVNTITEKSDADEASEWREIKLVQHRQTQETSGSGSTVKTNNSPETTVSVSQISYAEAAGYYAETPDVMQHRDIIVSEDFPRGSCLTCLSRPRLTFAGAIEERDRVFCIAATAFDAHNDVVVGILQTIYRKITKSPRDVLLIGRHWEDIGFQGTDPSTDLRGCGVLSLLQILYLVDTYPDLAHRFHGLSQHPTRHFPFACVLINITLQCVVALRNGVLYPECNKHASVLSGMNRLYVALTSHLHDAIQSRFDDIPLIMKEVLDRGRSNPAKFIDEAFDGPTLRPSRPAVALSASKLKGADRKEADNNLEFTEIGLHSVDEE
ncbi:ELMO domain-containing protein 3 [Phytophthora cinnamomi]|uniref:ELMO domain-containing protein 3 n=1 Tax=Phytophthora cinnamomi TaxID=4785 RepID=UPI00355A62BF|nr:ELMO domain-containing protein 3 [Phytophthora cinnamomi]